MHSACELRAPNRAGMVLILNPVSVLHCYLWIIAGVAASYKQLAIVYTQQQRRSASPANPLQAEARGPKTSQLHSPDLECLPSALHTGEVRADGAARGRTQPQRGCGAVRVLIDQSPDGYEQAGYQHITPPPVRMCERNLLSRDWLLVNGGHRATEKQNSGLCEEIMNEWMAVWMTDPLRKQQQRQR